MVGIAVGISKPLGSDTEIFDQSLGARGGAMEMQDDR
jgi:hypothetical protein